MLHWYYATGLKVPAEAEAKLRSVSARKRVSKSEYVRATLIAALNAEKDRPSVFDLVQDIAECVSSGKKDMATNPKYMKGYGKWHR